MLVAQVSRTLHMFATQVGLSAGQIQPLDAVMEQPLGCAPVQIACRSSGGFRCVLKDTLCVSPTWQTGNAFPPQLSLRFVPSTHPALAFAAHRLCRRACASFTAGFATVRLQRSAEIKSSH